MATIDTREQLIRVARRLFAQKGIENITMSDIAAEAKRSRRTVYTYFKSKEELLEASIEMEVNKISNAITKVALSNLTPEKKIIRLIFVRLHATRSVVRRNSRLSSEYFNNTWIIEHLRHTFDSKEIALFRAIIADGKLQGIFNVESPDLAARFLHFCLKGIEIPYINGIVNKNIDDKFMNQFTERVILNALGARTNNKEES
ncbi:MAG: TetR/AcrR family transcriptional regulator [Bacteroidaceae bacterium]|nr:TetR/AcrR family transcriptional regulator [Bacteroidaceae bacterium]